MLFTDTTYVGIDTTSGRKTFTYAALDRGYIEAATELCGGNMSEAARRLGINRTTLYNRMESWTRR